MCSLRLHVTLSTYCLYFDEARHPRTLARARIGGFRHSRGVGAPRSEVSTVRVERGVIYSREARCQMRRRIPGSPKRVASELVVGLGRSGSWRATVVPVALEVRFDAS